MKNYTKKDFMSTTVPYELLLSKENDPSTFQGTLEELQENALKVGVKNFNRIYKLFKASL